MATKACNQTQRGITFRDYDPDPVKGVRLPKPQGGYRQLGIPTVKDRLVQQAIHHVLNPQYVATFSARSYGFRKGKNAHGALRQAAHYSREGKTTIVDLDLATFFDEVNHHRLLWILGTRIGDKRVVDLIHKFLKTGMMEGGLTPVRKKGAPQGSPLSPLLSNIVLDELDQELSRRGYSFVRYADDLQIFCKDADRGENIAGSVTKFIEGKMKLKVNRAKSAVRKCWESNFLGHSIILRGKLGLSSSSEERLKLKLKAITRRSRGVSLETILKELTLVLPGWLEYFKYASIKRKWQS